MLATSSAGAANWTVIPDITLRETYTDNAFLASAPGRHDFVTQVTPGIRVDGRSPRLTANLSYAPTALFYAHNSSANNIANRLNAFGRLEAVEKFFYVEANGNISQNYISPFAAQPNDLITITPNRVETRTFGVSPYVRGQFHGEVNYELRNRNTWTSTNNSALGNFHTTQWAARVASPVRRFGWTVEYDNTDIRYDVTPLRLDQESRLYRGRLHFQPDIGLRLSAIAGREQNNYIVQEKRSYRIYGAGLSWKPGPRTAADLEWERRYFGPSGFARLNHRTRLTAWNVSYSRNASTFQQELLRLPPGNTAALLDAIFAARIPDPNERRTAVEQFTRANGTPPFLANSLAFYTPRIFLREALDASFGILGTRNSITFSAFRSESTSLSSDAGTSLSDAFLTASKIGQRGFSVRADHKLTPFTSVGASGTRSLSRQEQPAGPDVRNDYATLTLNHTVSPKTTTFAGVSVTRFVSNAGSVAAQNANTAFAGLNHRF
jgi:uncharacterized protein (PEP-CTERM system associated)